MSPPSISGNPPANVALDGGIVLFLDYLVKSGHGGFEHRKVLAGVLVPVLAGGEQPARLLTLPPEPANIRAGEVNAQLGPKHIEKPFNVGLLVRAPHGMQVTAHRLDGVPYEVALPHAHLKPPQKRDAVLQTVDSHQRKGVLASIA